MTNLRQRLAEAIAYNAGPIWDLELATDEVLAVLAAWLREQASTAREERRCGPSGAVPTHVDTWACTYEQLADEIAPAS